MMVFVNNKENKMFVVSSSIEVVVSGKSIFVVPTCCCDAPDGGVITLSRYATEELANMALQKIVSEITSGKKVIHL